MGILIVEDERAVAWHIQSQLQKSGYDTEVAHDGKAAARLGETTDYDAVILDLGLPQLDGLSVLKGWRSLGRTMPVIVLTARESWPERVSGINAGADDYLPKPFVFEELLARLKAVLRRAQNSSPCHMSFGKFSADLTRHELTKDGETIDLTPLEFRLFTELASHRGEVLSARTLIERIYGSGDQHEINVLERLIARLRRKIGANVIETCRGRGYVMGQAR